MSEIAVHSLEPEVLTRLENQALVHGRTLEAEVKVILTEDEKLPPLPKPDKHGRFPALQYARISLARDLIRDRKGVGLSQQRLADLAGIRQETLSRIETGRHTASRKTVDKIMRVIEAKRQHSQKGG